VWWRAAAVGHDVLYGARPLKRAIFRHILNPLSKKVLAGEVRAPIQTPFSCFRYPLFVLSWQPALFATQIKDGSVVTVSMNSTGDGLDLSAVVDPGAAAVAKVEAAERKKAGEGTQLDSLADEAIDPPKI
jgi:hypothetical protein